MAQEDISDLTDAIGDFLFLSTQSDFEKKDITFDQPEDFKDDKFRYAVYTQTEEDDPQFRYVNYLVPEQATIDKNGSTCIFRIDDPVNNKLSDWGLDPATINDSYTGFFYDKTISPRYRAMIVMLGKGKSVPASGSFTNPIYSADDDNIVLWSGFNKTGAELSAGGGPGDKIRMTFSGIEQAINDLSVNGIIGWELYSGIHDINSGTLQSLQETLGKVDTGAFNNTFHSYAYKAIFNEGGRPDQMDFSSFPNTFPENTLSEEQQTGAAINNRYFNKAGEGPVIYWTIADIIFYLELWYVEVSTNLDQKLPDTFDIKTKFSDYVIVSDDIPTELFNEIPTDLNLEGLGVFDAFVEVMRHSTRFDIAGGYDIDGKFKFRFDPKLETTSTGVTIRTAEKFEITLSRGNFGDTYNRNKIVNNSTINVNRENSRIGRVIVIGDRVRINTMFTTLANAKNLEDIPRASSNADTYIAVTPSFIEDDEWKEYMELYVKDTMNDHGIPGVQFNFSTLNIIKDQSNSFMAKLMPLISSELNDDTKTKLNNTKLFIADSFEVPLIEFGIKSSFSEDHQQKQDSAFFVTDKIITSSDKNPDENNAEDGFDWMFVIPIEKSTVIKSRKSSNSGRSGSYVILYASVKLADKFNEQFERTPMSNRINRDGVLVKSLGVARFPIPFFARVILVTQYRLKGISKITKATHGIDFDPAKHATKIINDDRFKLNLSFNDATYSTSKTNKTGNDNVPDTLNGSFLTVPDGFIGRRDGTVDPKRTDPITNIQAEADGWLDRLVTIPQNSGTLNLRSIQKGIQVGQFITEVEGGGRTIAFKAFIQSISYNFEKWEMSIGLGNVNDRI